MRLTNSTETYGLIHQILHWATAGLILFMIPLGPFMHELPHDTQLEIDFKVWLYSLHKSVGIAALFVALTRIAWAVVQPHPRLLNGGVEAVAAQTIHFILYGLIVAVPVFGWLHHAATDGFAPVWWWGLADTLPFVPKSDELAHFFGTAHWLAAIGLVLSLFLHIGGAIKHAVIDKDRILQRMVPGAYLETGMVPPVAKTGRTPLVLALAAFVLGAVAVAIVHFSGNLGHHAQPDDAAGKAGKQAVETTTPDAAFVPNWIIDYGASEISVSVSQMGSPVEGKFSTFNADVLFDPQTPESGVIKATIPTGGFQFGSNTDQALSGDFLNVAAFPAASYQSDNIVKTDAGYRAEGVLSLVGQEHPQTLDFSFSEVDGVAQVVASATITRLQFGIGNAYQGDDTVGREVIVVIKLTAKRK